jgi:hypothetical protein
MSDDTRFASAGAAEDSGVARVVRAVTRSASDGATFPSAAAASSPAVARDALGAARYWRTK